MPQNRSLLTERMEKARQRDVLGLKYIYAHDSAEETFAKAGEIARSDTVNSGLEKFQDKNGDWTNSPKQAVFAACIAREDTQLIAQIQLAVLQRLDRNRNYMRAVIAILSYIAYRLS